jgi:VWFA-related protein
MNMLSKALQSLESSDYLYLYLLTREAKLYPVHGIPGATGETPRSDGTPWTKEGRALLEQAINKVYGIRPVDMDIDVRTRLTYRALENVSNLLSGIPGRKDVVWITHGVPISLGPNNTILNETIDYTPLLRRMSLAFDRANVAIYPIQQDPPGTNFDDQQQGAEFRGMGSADTLQQFADLTGGPAKSTSGIAEVLRQAMNDVRSSYLVGFYPAADNWDGKFHKLRITCRRKGVRIQAKTGYYAWAEQVSDEQEALESGASSQFDSAEIGMRGTAAKAEGKTRFSIRIDPGDVRITQAADRFTAHLSVMVVGYANGQAEMSKPQPYNLNMTADEHTKALANWVEFTQVANLGENVESVRFVVFDRDAHALGSLTIPVKAASK